MKYGIDMKYLLSLLLLCIMPACSFFDSRGSDVSAHSGSEEVILSNETSERVYYFVVGRRIAALINWIQHLDPAMSVAPGGEQRIGYDEIMQVEGGEEEAIVYWWYAEQQGEEAKPGKLHLIIVDL